MASHVEAAVNGAATGRASARGDLAVVMICEWCGKPIRLVAGEIGPEIEDADAFLAVHASCLRQRPVPPPGPQG